MRDLSQLSEVVVLAIKAAQAPLLAQLAAAEQRIKDMEARLSESATVRDRLVALETKTALHFPDGSFAVNGQLSDKQLAELRDRIVVIETKAARPDDDTDLLDILHRLRTVEAVATAWEAPAAKTDTHLENLTKDLGALRERVAVVEVRPLMPGPQGPSGTAGRDGTNGRDGVDGFGFEDLDATFDGDRTLTLKFEKGAHVKTFPLRLNYWRWLGVYQDGATYLPGDAATWGGSMWHCNEETTTKPGDGNKAWSLAVKRGRDGRDGVDAPTVPVVSVKR